MKRILFVLAFIASGAGAQTVSVGTVTAQCGSTVNVPVSIDNASGLLALEFRVAYDTARLTLTTVTAGALTSGFSVAHNAAGGVVTVAMASGSPVSGSGTVATLAFSVASSATGTAPLTISNVLVNDVPRSGTSGAVTITCLQPPAAPALTAPANGATGATLPVTLQWESATGASSYRVFLGTTSAPPLIATTAGTSLVPTLQPATTYYWSVEAFNDAGAAATSVRSFTTAGVACVTPGAPQITAPAQVTSGNAFDVGWTAVSSATEYVVEEAMNAAFSGASTTTTGATALSLTRTVTADTTFYFRVRARNTASGCSNEGGVSSSAAVRVVPRPSIAASTKILPVAGTIEGTGGSLFRTAVQLHNPTTAPISGRIVFHQQGSSGSDADPSVTYSLAPGATVSYADLLAAIGVSRAIGSADIVPASGSASPTSAVRIFNDAGSAGTTGMSVEALEPGEAIQAGQRGVLIAPSDPSRLRMNIGIRTLLDGATILVTVRDKLGATILSSRWSYAPTSFVQVSIMQFANAVLLGDETVTFAVESGSAIVYGTLTDNVTNDPSIALAR